MLGQPARLPGLDGRPGAPAASRPSRAHAVWEAVDVPRPGQLRVGIGTHVLAPAAVRVLVVLQPGEPPRRMAGLDGGTPAAMSAGSTAPVP